MEKHSSNALAKSLSSGFKRFHLILFFIFIVAVLASAVILINQILTGENKDDGYTSSINAGSIDEVTLNKVQALHESNSAPTPTVPDGRINPFTE